MSSDGSSGSVSPRESREGATAPDAAWENHGPHAPQRSRRYRGRPVSPDPFMFHTTIWMEHDPEASARAHSEPIEQLRDRVRTMEANLETLRTRLTQVADLRDAQGLREGHRALIASPGNSHSLLKFSEFGNNPKLTKKLFGRVSKLRRLQNKVCRKAGLTVGLLHGHNFCSCSQAREFWAIVTANADKDGKE